MRVRRWLPAAAVLLLIAVGALAWWVSWGPGGWLAQAEAWGTNDIFLVEPYLQLGDGSKEASSDRLALLWLAVDRDARWSVEERTAAGSPWRELAAPTVRRIALEGPPAFRLGRAVLEGLTPGGEFDYRVRRDGQPVFEARARARKPAGTPHRFVAFGDCGANTPEQRAVAYQTWLAEPDFVLITGDIAYTQGRVSEYLKKFFPAYNRSSPSASTGAPLMRSTLFIAAPGNHDLLLRDLKVAPDGLAYFFFWDQPLNGPLLEPQPNSRSGLQGSQAQQRAFLDAAGAAYPRMANFSFDYGDAHWTVLDANTYTDMTGSALRDWLEQDLASAKNAAWRFVTFHQPPFSSSKAHREDQRTRALVDIFEKGKVDLVFCGHVHNYQRTFPLHFVAEKGARGEIIESSGRVNGRWKLDRSYDGRVRTTPDGIIYIVTGAGGARLYNTEQNDDSSSWQEYTARFVSNVHSLTIVDLDVDKLVIRQVSHQGKELDRFVVTKPQNATSGTMDRRNLKRGSME